MTRRQAIIATILGASFANTVSGQTLKDGTFGFFPMGKLKLHLQLDDFEAIEVQRGKAIIRDYGG